MTVSKKTIGLAPGSLVYTGTAKSIKPTITVIDYNENELIEKPLKITACAEYKNSPNTSWINIIGIHDEKLIEKLGKQFDIHALVLEDILNIEQRPKFEDYKDYIFFTLKMLSFDEANRKVKYEQVSFILGKTYVISLQEVPGDVFDPVRDRMRNNKGKVRQKGADYLLYILIDAVIENYYFILEKISDFTEDLEAKVLQDVDEKVLLSIQKLKRDLILLRKSVYPLRESVGQLDRSESILIDASTYSYLKDLYDHTIQTIESVEGYRDIITGLTDVYMTTVSNRMNNVMKVLTIIATIFIPLTFIAGIYGMNFDHMPELHFKWAYPAVWILMIAVTIGMLIFFKKKRWL